MHNLILAILCSVAVSVLLKVARKKNIIIEQAIAFNYIVLFPFALKHRHLSGQPSHLMALYLAFSLTYPDAVFT